MYDSSSINLTPRPKQSHSKLSFCNSSKPQKVSAWIEQLHLTQIMPTAILLYNCIPEINTLSCDAQTRFDILETLRPTIHNIINGLTKEFLNKPIALPEEAKKTALLAQSLQRNLISGYLLCAQEIIDTKKVVSKLSHVFNHSIHRAMSGIGDFFLRSYQLYINPAAGLWKQLHQLYLSAEKYQILDYAVTDPLSSKAVKTTIKSSYLRVLLLATTRPNQLGQQELAEIYKHTEVWSTYLNYHREHTTDSSNLFSLDLTCDAPPHIKGSRDSLFNSTQLNSKQSNSILELDFKQLLAELTRPQNNNTAHLERSLNKLPSTIIRHITHCWTQTPERSQPRRPSKGQADISVGLRNIHDLINPYSNLESLIQNIHSNHDETAQGVIPNEHLVDSTQNNSLYNVSVQNTSRNGYCVLWPKENTTRLDSGELIAIRDHGRRIWTLCVVRWIKQCKQGAQLGIQILSDHPKAIAIAQKDDTQIHNEYGHAIYLPASKTENLGATIITPAAPFEETNHLNVVYDTKEHIWVLKESIFSTPSLQQFTFEVLKG